MDNIKERIAELSPEKLALLIKRLKKDKSPSEDCIIQRKCNSNEYPMSSEQKGIWFLQQLKPESTFYNIPAAVRIKGALNVQALIGAIKSIIKRHEVLRANFTLQGDEPREIIRPFDELAIDIPVLEYPDASDIQARIGEAIIEERDRKFSLAEDSLIRAKLIAINKNEHLLFLTFHHIISDGWSLGIFIKELSRLYKSYSENKEPELEELPIQYTDYAFWQESYLKSTKYEKSLSYWKEKLGGMPVELSLPLDKKRPTAQSFAGSHYNFSVSPEVAVSLREQFKALNVNGFVYFLTAFEILLSRYSNQYQFGIGLPVANRSKFQTQESIGLFTNTVVIRADLAESHTVSDVLKGTKDSVMDAFENQECPFEKVVNALKPEHNTGLSPLFQAVFDFQNRPLYSLKMDGLDIEIADIERGTSKYDLTLSVEEGTEGYKCTIEYSTDLFFEETIERMSGSFLNILKDMAGNENKLIGELLLLSEKERNRILYEWNNTRSPYPREETFHHLFELQALETPDKTAVVYENKKLTFRALNRRANRLAHTLIAMGVGPERIVCLYMDRSVDIMVAIFAILKAGGAYLPLDVNSPVQRLKMILDDIKDPIILTQNRLKGRLKLEGINTLGIDEPDGYSHKAGYTNPVTKVCPENLAYIIYTSGSTGRPKGAMITHRSIVNLVHALDRDIYSRALNKRIKKKSLPEGKPLRLMMNSSLIFDASIQQMILITKGHCIYILPDEIRRDGRAFVNYIRKHRIEVLDCVPSQLTMLLESGLLEENKYCPFLVLPGGEAISMSVWKELSKTRRTEFFNMYGPTETTVEVTAAHINDSESQPVIGKPLDNVRLYVLDKYHNPQPVGVTGELFIAGECLGRGYLNRPEVTAEKFIPNPFAEISGERIYRTGDLARYTHKGDVEYMGRLDSQVKIRGFRIELGEIESAINELPAIKESLVVVREDTANDRKIVAYLIPKNKGAFSPREIKQMLKGKLPEYMIPSYLMVLEDFPLMPSGKIDKKMLPAPKPEDSLSGNEFLAPKTALECELARMCEDVLNVKNIGLKDNFFELGGDSIKAAIFMNRIRSRYKEQIPVKAIFENPALLDLSAYLLTTHPGKFLLKGASSISSIKKASRNDEIPLSYTQERMWFLEQLEPGKAVYNLPIMFRIKGELNPDLLAKSLNEIIRRHEVLRLSLTSTEGKAKAKLNSHVKVKCTLTDLRALSKGEQDDFISRILEETAAQPIPLDNAPLFRTSLLAISEKEYLLIAVFHHIIMDEWSSRVIISELSEIYTSLKSGRRPLLPELKIQYADYAIWQREYLQGENLEHQMEYWKRKLTGIPTRLELPYDHPRPLVQSYRGDYMSRELDQRMVKLIRESARQYGVTLFMMMLSVYEVLLYRMSNQNDLVIGTPVANRNKEELEPLIGFFVNTLVIRSNLDGSMRFRELLQETMQTSLEAYTFQDLPFEMLVDALEPERTLSHSPIFQVMFALQNAPEEEYEFTADLRLTPYEVHSMTSKFDLTMLISDKSEESISMAFEYNTDLFDKETIERMFRHYELILECVLKNPDSILSGISLLSREEERAILEKMSGINASPFSPGEMVHVAFENTASLMAGNTALIFMGSKMTFGELNSRSNRLAHYLVKRGIGPETVVGVALRRSPELIISLLGVLKAGGCYLPLDTNYPEDRLHYIIADSNLKLLITEKDLSSKFGAGMAETVLVDLQWKEIEQESSLNPEIQGPFPDNLAYIIYTSGSTGNPKGTMITHKNLTNYLSWCQNAYPLSEETGSVFHLSISFDAAITSIYPALLSGTPVRIIPEGKDIYLLGKELMESGATGTLKITPAHLDILAENLRNEASDGRPADEKIKVGALVVGGENLTGKQIAFYQDNYPGTLIFNEYGPTEATVGCIVHEASRHKTVGSVPIGRVIPGVYACILDDNMSLVGENTPGELYIGGLGISRGYLAKPELTAEKFIPDPFSGVPGMRIYRTGDKAKLLKDGNIEFLGRLDGQVKLHGYRIEPGEIEAVLKQHPEVKEALVLKHDLEEKLVAYCIPKNEHDPEIKELREFLEKKVPGYMVPSIFVFIEQFPITVNGKIDRKKLPEARLERSGLIKGYVAPASEAELIMTGIWQSVLNIDNIGITDNFFELGGDSIISIQLVARANQAGFRLTPKDIFQNPTIKSLVRAANSERIINAGQGIVTGEIPLSPVQHWFFDQKLFNIHHNNQSVLFEVDESLNPELLGQVLKEILLHHDALRISFQKNKEGWQQFNRGTGLNIPLEGLDVSAFSDEELPGRIRKLSTELQGSLNISNELFKVAYFDTGKNRKHYLLIVIHHLIIDAVSWRILLDDFQTAYEQASRERQIRLPLKTSSFMEWSKRLNEYAQSPEVIAEFNFWQKLENCQARTVPSDYLPGEEYFRDRNLESSVRTVHTSLETEETAAMLKEVPAVLNAEIMHSLLAALVRAFGRKTGMAGLLFELENHGRVDIFPELDLSRTIGWFTSIYPVYLDLEGSSDLKGSVEKVKEQLSLIPNHGIGFGVLKYLSKDESLRSGMRLLPSPEIAFNYLGQFEENPSLSGSSTMPVELSKGPERDPGNKRLYLIEITAAIVSGRLEVDWSYSSNIYKESTILELAGAYLEEIRAIVNLVKSQKIDLRAKDFSEFGWNQQEVNDILSVINGLKE
ncbi:MAG: amino acid adenylation domain-containing protein [Ignavibacteria bacterium]|jgi:amino acid adenylation domain-containing protein/non-ribosomal peptide synthase protein (TIGR01720 family)|nr:amino acid adenylation domain-containing protein [Ignavibacteria bacterium]